MRLYPMTCYGAPLCEYRVVYRGRQIGTIDRYRRRFARGKQMPWTAVAWLSDGNCVIADDTFVRRGDAKRWVLQNQTEVLL